jgi:hypothetical protein
MNIKKDDDRAARLFSIVLVPIGIAFVVLWLLIFYTVIVRVSHLNWPTPFDWLPPDWARGLPRPLRFLFIR